MPVPAPPSAALDVFLSYAREDRPTAAKLAAALQARGLSVWWDREILGGAEFSEVIERELIRARVALVLWSAQSVRSPFVRDESARAQADGKLLPLRIEDVSPPLGFGQLQTLDLLDWDGEDDAPAFAELVAHVQRHLKGDAVPLPDGPRGRRFPVRRRTLFAGGAALAAAGVGWFGWHQLVGRDSERAQELTAQGIDKFEARLFVQARFLFNQALEADDAYAPASFYLAQVLIQDGAPQEAAANLRLALKLKHGLDGGQLRDAERWLTDLAAGASDPAPVKRVALAEAAPPAATRPPSPPTAIAKPAPPASVTLPPSGALLSKLGGAERRSLPLTGAALDQLKTKIEQMFSPSKEARLAATTGLIVDANTASDAVPPGVQRALQAQRNGTPKDPAELAGVINVLTLLQSATPSTLALHAAEIRRLLDAARRNGPQTAELVASVAAALDHAEKQLPLVYIQIATESQRALANALAARLRGAAYRVPAAEVVGTRAPARTEIRVQGRSDQSLARWMAKAAGEIAGAPVEVKTLRNAKPKVDTFEIWLDAALCVAPDRRPAACGT